MKSEKAKTIHEQLLVLHPIAECYAMIATFMVNFDLRHHYIVNAF